MRIQRAPMAFAFFALIAGGLSAGATAAPAPGDRAPDFSLRDLDGRTVKLGDYAGKVVLLSFSTTWCPHCRTAVPGLNKIAAAHKDKEFVLLGIYIQESQKKVSAFVAKHGIAYRVLLDGEGTVAAAYGVRGIPSKTLVGKDGKVVCRDCRDAEKELEKLLGGAEK